MITLVCFKVDSPEGPETPQGTQEQGETARPWAEAVLQLSWAGLLCTVQQGWGL